MTFLKPQDFNGASLGERPSVGETVYYVGGEGCREALTRENEDAPAVLHTEGKRSMMEHRQHDGAQ